MIYECKAKCHELDYSGTPHCRRIIENTEDEFHMRNYECPCGNETKFEPLENND